MDPDVDIQGALDSIEELASLEVQTSAAEINLYGMLRHRLSPAARYADKVPVRYRRINFKTERESEQLTYLNQGFPGLDSGKPIFALMVVDNFATIELDSSQGGGEGLGQFAGDRLYLSMESRWILAERVGAYSEIVGSSSQWDAECRIVSDRMLLNRYPLEVVVSGLMSATNKLWERLSPRINALKKRSEKIEEVSRLVSKLGSPSKAGGGSGANLRNANVMNTVSYER